MHCCCLKILPICYQWNSNLKIILVLMIDVLVDGVYPQGTDTYLLAYQIWYIRRTVPLFSQSFLKLWQVVRMIVAVVVEVESLEGLGHSYQTVATPTEG
ncbi:hypothetical protein P3S67_014338 [Capsicum chacoense]